MKLDEKPLTGESFQRYMEKDRKYQTEKTIRNLKMKFQGPLPVEMTSNSNKECKILEYLNRYQSSYNENYGERALFLSPLNEAGVPKFISSFIRPTLSCQPELYDFYSCVQTFSNYLFYEELEVPLQPPESIVSPYTTLKHKSGDSSDFAVLDASLLEGVGYDVFVVYGTANLEIFKKDENNIDCYFLKEDDFKFEKEIPADIIDSSKKQKLHLKNEQNKNKLDEEEIKSSLKKKQNLEKMQSEEANKKSVKNKSNLINPNANTKNSNFKTNIDKSLLGSKTSLGSKKADVAFVFADNNLEDEQPKNMFEKYNDAKKTDYNPYIIESYTNQDLNYENYIFSCKTENGKEDRFFLKNKDKFNISKKFATNFKSFLNDDEQTKIRNREKLKKAKDIPNNHFDNFSSEQQVLINEQNLKMKMALNTGVHFWLLIRPNHKRDIKTNIFIDPASGKYWTIDDPNLPFLSVKQIFNSKNCWINLNEQIKIKYIDFATFDDFKNETFEYVLNENGVVDDLNVVRNCLEDLTKQSDLKKNPEQKISQFQDFVRMNTKSQQNQSIIDQNSLVQSKTKFMMPSKPDFEKENTNKINLMCIEKNKKSNQECTKELIKSSEKWVPYFEVDPEIFKTKFSKRRKHDFFKRTQVEYFTENLQSDHLTRKVQIFINYSRIYLHEIRSYYSHRPDNLRLKKEYPFEFKTIEYYDPFSNLGSNGINTTNPQWKEIETIAGRKIIFRYYNTRFIDGLIEREEIIGEKTMIRFENREDKLIYLSVRFRKAKNESEKKDLYIFENRHSGKSVILKMVQKFEKKIFIDFANQISKVTFDFEANKIEVRYHSNSNQISPKITEFSREIFTKMNTNNCKKDSDCIQGQTNIALLYQMERECLSKIKISEMELSNDISAQKTLICKPKVRMSQNGDKISNGSVQSKSSNSKLLSVKKNKMKQKEESFEIDLVHDPIEVALKNKGLNQKHLNPVLCDEIKEDILSQLQNRLIQRADVMSKRFDKEKENLKILKDELENKTKLVQNLDVENEPKENQLHKFNLKIAVLEERLFNFQKTAFEKYSEMQTFLNNDPRLNLTSDFGK